MSATIFDSKGNGDDFPKCEEDFLHFHLKLCLNFLQALGNSAFKNGDKNHYDIFHSLYYLWVFLIEIISNI